MYWGYKSYYEFILKSILYSTIFYENRLTTLIGYNGISRPRFRKEPHTKSFFFCSTHKILDNIYFFYQKLIPKSKRVIRPEEKLQEKNKVALAKESATILPQRGMNWKR